MRSSDVMLEDIVIADDATIAYRAHHDVGLVVPFRETHQRLFQSGGVLALHGLFELCLALDQDDEIRRGVTFLPHYGVLGQLELLEVEDVLTHVEPCHCWVESHEEIYLEVHELYLPFEDFLMGSNGKCYLVPRLVE
jgi:hypothetical protein